MIKYIYTKNNISLPLLLCILVLSVPCLAVGTGNSSSNTLLIQANTDTLKVDSTYVLRYINNEPEFRHHRDLVKQFYLNRNFTMAWFDENKLVPQADKLMEAINKAHKQGLNPKDYKIKNIKEMYQQFAALETPDNRKQQEIDIALTASYFNYASDFYKGEVDPHSAAAIEWEVKRNKIKLDKVLENILKERESTYPFYEFEALHDSYKRLQNALVKYRQLQQQGGWPKVEDQGVIKLNDTAKVVVALRKRLLAQQQVNEQDSTAYVYDQQVQAAVSKFQERLGLLTDGIVGPQTYQALNISVQERIDQILLNMERWKWLPKELAPGNENDRYIMVNIPAFKVSVMENNQEVMQMKAVVGKTMHATPIFSHEIQYLMFAPYWNVPNSIVEQDMKPNLQRNQNWLASRNMEMVTTFGPDARKVPVNRVNWNTMTQHNFDYRIRQRPGKNNALGLVKFMFPNEYAVYLHDTPADHLFSEAERDLSHGCVRVERPADLATYLLQDVAGWDRNRVEKAMHASEQQRVDLKTNVPVYLVYFTAWADEDGTVHFRDDIYNHDRTLASELF